MSAGTSLRQLARLIGVSEKAVRKALAAGVFKGSVRRAEGGPPVVLDVALAVAEWERSGRQLRGSARARAARVSAATPTPVDTDVPSADEDGDLELETDQPESAAADALPLPFAGAPGGELPQMTLVDAQTMTMRERARKLKLENDEREGKLLDADVVKREAFEFARVVRESVLNVPARLSAELAAESNATRVHLRLEAALREALETTASTLESAPID